MACHFPSQLEAVRKSFDYIRFSSYNLNEREER